MALDRWWKPSPCYHGRATSGVRLIVLHTAEGATTIESLGNFFANYSNQVSSHVGADDQRGKIGEYVTRGNAAWTAADFNNAAVQLELCGFASWSRSTWLNQHENMVRNAAAWVAEEAKKFGLPIVALGNSQAQGGGRGVTQHINLGSGGGGHVDCGSGFPMDKLIEWAKGGGGAAAAPQPTYREEDRVMQLVFDEGNPDAAEMPACALALPNEFSGGKHKMRFTCRRPVTLRVIIDGARTDVEVDDNVAMSVMIPDGKRSVVIKREDMAIVSPVSMAISER